MPVIRIEDEFVTFEVDGEVIAGPVSTRVPADGGRPRPRWMEATLYRKGDGSYVLHTVNRSLVWHLVRDRPGPCPQADGDGCCPAAGRRGVLRVMVPG